MTDSRKVVSIFLGSPGDLRDERTTAKSVVDEINQLWGGELGYQVELIGWEDTVSVFGRPQSTINHDLDKCEYFIGLMWRKWGTPPDAVGPFTSGFEEEFTRSVANRERSGSPEISLFFKDIESQLLQDPGDDLKRVLAFRDLIIAEKKILFETFRDTGELEVKLRRCISKYLQRLKRNEVSEQTSQEQTPTPPENDPPDRSNDAPTGTRLTPKAAQFLRSVVTNMERAPLGTEFDAVEVARFRLFGSTLRGQGNDDYSLGVHDSNLVFAARQQLTLEIQELGGLITAALSNFSSENTPLWYWYAKYGGFTEPSLAYFSVGGPSERRVGALYAMRLVGESVPSADDETRGFIVHSWFSDVGSADLKIAALAYLGENGTAQDVAIIKKEFLKGDYQTVGAATEACIRIALRSSRDEAISAILELQPQSVSVDLLSEIFDRDSELSTETLRSGLDHRSASVRRAILRLLVNRKALNLESVEQLTADSDINVRFDALQLVAAVKPVSDSDVKRILSRPKGGLGLLAAFDRSDEDLLDRFRAGKMAKMSNSELTTIAQGEDVFDYEAKFLLDARHFSKRGDSLRHSVNDQFNSEYQAALANLSRDGNPSPHERAKPLGDFMRKKLTQRGLDIICENGEPNDVSLVRRALKSQFAKLSRATISFLGRCGEWQDIILMVSSLKNDADSANPLTTMFPSQETYRAAAQAICAIGGNRLGEILNIEGPPQLTVQIIAASADRDFKMLEPAAVGALLDSQDHAIRKITALKCVKTLSKSQVARILERQLDRTHFYNVVHWLDLGVSAPRGLAKQVAAKELRKLRF